MLKISPYCLSPILYASEPRNNPTLIIVKEKRINKVLIYPLFHYFLAPCLTGTNAAGCFLT